MTNRNYSTNINHQGNAQDIMDLLKRAYKKFLTNDSYLIDSGANERSMTHKYAEYLQQEFPSWHVDCEYNRAKDDTGRYIPKAIYNFIDDRECGHRVYPDIIIHHRGTSDNLIVIEAKKHDAKEKDIEFDELKIKCYLEEHDYLYGFLVTFTDDPECAIKPRPTTKGGA